jgi:hypothetical protein
MAFAAQNAPPDLFDVFFGPFPMIFCAIGTMHSCPSLWYSAVNAFVFSLRFLSPTHFRYSLILSLQTPSVFSIIAN